MPVHRVTLTQLLMGQRIQNVFHLSTDSVGSSVPSDMAADLKTFWIVYMRAIQSTALSYTSLAIQNLSTPSTAPYTEALSYAGTAAGWSPAMPFLCLVLKLGTAFAGRQGRGRVFVGGINHQAVVTTGLWDSGALSGVFGTCASNIMAKYGLGGSGAFRLVVQSHDAGGGTGPHTVTSVTARSTPGLQRRRSIGVGA